MRLVLPTGSSTSELTPNDVCVKYDVIYQDYVDHLLKRGNPKYLVNDHLTTGKFNGISFFGIPFYAKNQTKLLKKDGLISNDIDTQYCFNFIINKKQINRYLCIKLVELFDLKNFNYTWSAIDQRFDCSEIIKELNNLGEHSPLKGDQRSFILSPIALEKKFIYHTGVEDEPSNGLRIIVKDNVKCWNNGVNRVIETSAISLITESLSFQLASCYTEKTLYAVLGLTFPIWIGGYNQAAEWKRFGFDIFEDIIDHSYQSYDTLIERCYYAIFNNLHLLNDLEKITQLRTDNLDRLLKNRELLLQNQLGKFIDKEICGFPADLQTVMPDIIKFFRNEIH